MPSSCLSINGCCIAVVWLLIAGCGPQIAFGFGIRKSQSISRIPLSHPSSFQSHRHHLPVQTTRTPNVSLSSNSRLFSMPVDGDSSNNKKPPLKSRLFQVIQSVASFPLKFLVRFQALSKKAKRIVTLQLTVLVFMIGGLTRSVYVRSNMNNMPTTPIVEIPYSRFLSLMEVQSQHSVRQAGALQPRKIDLVDDVPFVDQVQIAPDRITYNVYQQSRLAQEGGTKAPSSKSDSPSINSLLQAAPQTNRGPKRTIKATTISSSDEGSDKQLSVIRAFTRQLPANANPQVLELLAKSNIAFSAGLPLKSPNTVANALRATMAGFYFLILWRFYKTISRATGNSSSSDSPGKLANTGDLPLASFDDIQGMDDVKLEVMELVDTLRHPDKYAILGARAPTGLLLEGPPGTGKTMLARATAASAGVPLLYCSGSDFVEMFVGRGAARVRKLFERASKMSPCLIFIDELDALGKSRDMGLGPMGGMGRGANDEAEQTLNQLLACMDGLDSTRRICVLAATNRKEVLDPALIRPGRFDRIVRLKLPNAEGREAILRVHCKKLPGFHEGKGVDTARSGALGVGRRVDLSAVAAVTQGLSGAELEFIVNEAAIRAVRRVSAQIRDSSPTQKIVPNVEAIDFEASVANFFETRRKGGSNVFEKLWT